MVLCLSVRGRNVINQIWVHMVKPIYWHQLMLEESTVFIAGIKQGEQVAHE